MFRSALALQCITPTFLSVELLNGRTAPCEALRALRRLKQGQRPHFAHEAQLEKAATQIDTRHPSRGL
jgi:hypothetical protein